MSAIRSVAHVSQATGIVAVAVEVTNGSRTLPGTSVIGAASSCVGMEHLKIAHGSFPGASSHGILLGAKVASALFPGQFPTALWATTRDENGCAHEEGHAPCGGRCVCGAGKPAVSLTGAL